MARVSKKKGVEASQASGRTATELPQNVIVRRAIVWRCLPCPGSLRDLDRSIG